MRRPTPMPPQLSDDLLAARILSRDADLVDCLFLVKNGIPFDVAFSLDPVERLAWVVIFGEFNGLTFNWDSQSWDRPRAA